MSLFMRQEFEKEKKNSYPPHHTEWRKRRRIFISPLKH